MRMVPVPVRIVVLVAVERLKTPGVVAVIEVATNRVIKRIEVGAFATGIAVAD